MFIGAIVGYITTTIGMFILFKLVGVAATDPTLFLCGVPGLFSGLSGGIIGNHVLGRDKLGAVG